MKTWWGAARVDWREPPALWVFVGWLAAVMWPPLPVTWILWPATQSAGSALLDWRVLATLMGGIGVAATFAMINHERRHDGQPRSRFGVVVRFIVYGFLFSVICALLLALMGALWTAIFATGDMVRRLAEFKASLIVGMAFTPAALIVGVSYSIWAGIAAAIITFTPRAPNVRPNPFLMDRIMEPSGAARQPGAAPIADSQLVTEPETRSEPQPEPTAPPPPAGPHPETALEAAMRPDLDEHH